MYSMVSTTPVFYHILPNSSVMAEPTNKHREHDQPAAEKFRFHVNYLSINTNVLNISTKS